MARIDEYRKQHQELVEIVTKIASKLSESGLKQDSAEVHGLLTKLTGKLTFHLNMEDQGLYPDLLKHADEKIRATAKRFMDDMGGLKKAYTDYAKKWGLPDTIRNNPGGFITETKGVFDALGQRVKKEDSELYTLVK